MTAGDDGAGRTHWPDWIGSAARILVIALAIYVGGLVVVLGIIFATGGGVSCNDDCVPLARLANDVAPWGMILWIAASLLIATAVVRQRTRKSVQGKRSISK